MAFHVACPITCRRICYCTLGFPQKLQSEKGRSNFLEEVSRVEEFLSDPCSVRVNKESESSVQVPVPKIVVPIQVPTTKKTILIDGFGSGDSFGNRNGEDFWLVQKKQQALLQNSAAAASFVAEDFARKLETGGLVVPQEVSRERAHYHGVENEDSSAIKLTCSMCSCGENEGSKRAAKMVACKLCYKKYHRSCLKSWAQYRDLFHWSSWACPSCRVCEVCRRTGDPNKLMFCKRCDGAHHCYCQQPPHKNVSTGPYLCPKHTKCHSCGSTVPGSGLSTRWFLGYNYCDACGRLFVKGKYCPVCLKVYRDSESTPMVCCDACERWVHCHCDGISDEKYLQFQADRNLFYECNACRGECYQVKDLDDAVQELWRRRDNADQEQISSLRVAAGLPSQDEIFSISPYSDDDDYDPIMSKTGYGRSLKISVKGLSDKATKTPKEYGKKSSSKKYKKKKGYKVSSNSKAAANENFELHAVQPIECKLGDERNAYMQSYRTASKEIVSSVSPVNSREKCTINQAGSMKNSFIGEAVVNSEEKAPRVLHIKSSKTHGPDLGEGSGRQGSKSETVKGTKLVIHLGARNKNITSSPISEASSCLREQDLTTSNGSEDTSQRKVKNKKYMIEEYDGTVRLGDGKAETLDNAQQLQSSRYIRREGSLIKFGKLKSDEVSEVNPSFGGGNITKGNELPVTEVNTSTIDDILLRRHSKSTPNIHNERHDKTPSVLESLPKDPRPLLKLKFKTPLLQNRNSGVFHSEEDKGFIKGQRSKRKRPSPIMDKNQVRENEGDSELPSDSPIDDAVDANWILKKLGKDAIGKRVEVHQPADGSWHKGVVTDMLEGSSTLAVLLDDGRSNTLELEEQRVRFVSQKQKRSRA